MGILDETIKPEDLEVLQPGGPASIAPAPFSAIPGFDPPTGVPLRDISISEAGVLRDSINTIASAATGFATGFNKELANILGLPGDIVVTASSLIGLDAKGYIATGDDVERLLNMLGVATTVDNQDQVARIAHSVGRGVAMAVPFAVGGTALAMRQGGGPISRFLAEPFRQSTGVATMAELASGVGVGVADAALNEAEIDNHLLRFGITLAAGLAGPFGLSRRIREMGETPAALFKDEGVPVSVFEVARTRAEDQLLDKMKGVKDPKPFIDDALAVYMDDLRRIDPDDTRWPVEVKDQLVQRLKGRLQRGEKPRGKRPVQQEAAVVDEFLKRSQEASKRSDVATTKKAVAALERGWFDKSAAVRAALVNESGDPGKKAMMYFDLQAGASAWADHMTRAARREVYKGFTRGERDTFDRFIMNRRLREILVSRPKTRIAQGPDTPPVRNIQAYDKVEKDILAALGPDRAAVFNQRAQQYFDSMRTPLSDMLDNGLITPDEFTKLNRFDYTPLEFANALDPKIKLDVGGRTISVPSSGIRDMGGTVRSMLHTDTEVLLSQVYARSYGRIARNRANLELLDVARTQPDNPVVRLKKPKGDKEWTQLSVVENGKTRKMFMANDFVDQWVNLAPPIAGAKNAGFWTGADVVRLMATGINPEFAAANVFRDWFYAWMAPNELFGPTYSSFMPRGFGQLGKDLLTVLPDTVKMEGRALAYLREGGGMSFMTHGARGEVSQLPGRHTAWNTVKDVLGVLNSRSELWTRLAIRERALRNGMTPEEATWTARTQIDFSQGGSSAKFVDNFIPYLNASMQGVRGFTRAAQKDPAKMAAKLIQAMGATAGLWAYNKMTYPEVMSQIDQRVQANNFIFPLPGSYKDSAGNTRYRYLKIPVEHSFIAAKGVTDAAMSKLFPIAKEKITGEPQEPGELPDRELIEAFANSIPMVGDPIETASIPTIRFLLSLANFDMWLKDEVWRGPQDLPKSEEVREFPDTPTPPLAVDLAQAIKGRTGIEVSPERWSAAVHAFVPRNFYTTTLSSSYNKMTTGHWQPEGEDAKLVPNALLETRIPGIRRLLGTTHPLANIIEKTRKIVQEPAGEAFAETREADKRIARITAAPLVRQGEMEADYKQWVRTVTDADDGKLKHMRDSLNNRLMITKRLNKIFSRIEIPSRWPPSWWVTIAGLPSAQQASVFQKFKSEMNSSADRAAFSNIAKRVLNYSAPQFQRVLKRETRRLRGGSTNMIR